MDEMIFRLGDDHSAYLSPEQVREEDAEFAGENDYVGIGVLTNLVPERERVVILLVFPGSPAEGAGLASHDSILAVDGKPIVDEAGFHREYLRGPEGSTIDVTVQTPGEAPRQVTITRQRVTGSVPVPNEVLTTSEGKRIGYILLATFADDTVDDQLGDALRALTADAPLDGLILDNRQNGGGADVVARGALSYFTRGVVGHFVNRGQEQRALNVTGVDVNGSSNLPLVVLVGPNTVSFGEIYSGVLRDMGRATIIGETTGGNVELLRGYDFEDGSRAWIAHENFQPNNHPEQDWEETGIVPDLMVPSNWDEVTLLTDPAIQAALDFLGGSLRP
jgi:carboxyl-terminal processing protease